MTKTQAALNLVNSIEVQAIQAARAVKNACSEARKEIERRRLQGEDPNMEKLPGHYASIASATQAFNNKVIDIPTAEEVAALIASADSAESAPESE